jgi:hypothetical protein
MLINKRNTPLITKNPAGGGVVFQIKRPHKLRPSRDGSGSDSQASNEIHRYDFIILPDYSEAAALA